MEEHLTFNQRVGGSSPLTHTIAVRGRSMRILIDLDSVLMNLLPTWLYHLNMQAKSKLTVEDITAWDISKFFPTLTKEQIYAPFSWGFFWKETTPIDGAIEFVNKLIADGHKLYVCTSTHYTTLQHKLENGLLRYFDCFNYKDIIVTYDKHLINADILIDDYQENLKDFKGKRILFDYPYNRECPTEYYDIRCKNWTEIYDYIKSLT